DVEQRQYDKQGRIVQSTALGLDSATSGTLADAGISAERHVDSYYADGQMANQSNFGILGSKANLSVLAYDYDTLGRLKDYKLGIEVGTIYTNQYDYKIDEGSGQAASITVTRTDTGVQSQTVN